MERPSRATDPIPDPKVAVVIVTWNSEADLSRCLGALEKATGDVVSQVICVDNGSTDRSVEIARANRASVVALGRNTGFPAAVNTALERIDSPYVLLLNPDVIVEPDAIVTALATASDASVGLVGGNLRRPDGAPEPFAARRFRSLSALALETFGITRLFPATDRQHFPAWDRGASRDVPCISGAFVLARRDVLMSVNGLDESVFMYLEDQELCRQVHDLGLRVVFDADARGTHVGGGSTRRAPLDRQILAYLHRLDADIEFIARRSGIAARWTAVTLLLLRAVFGLIVGAVTLKRTYIEKYSVSVKWLVRQYKRRMPPPAIP
jgi:GT2 family glycosyltransferase